MTPFGLKLREMRARAGVTQKEMAAALGFTPAYLSALEHGRRGVPSWATIQKIIGYFNVIWDEAEALQQLALSSDPRVVVDTTALSPEATALANRFARVVRSLETAEIAELADLLEAIEARKTR